MNDTEDSASSLEAGVEAARPSGQDEEGRIADTVIAIRNLVANGPQDGCFLIQSAGANFSLSLHEGEAFRATFAGENSFRGRLAKAFVDLAAVYARMLSAFEEFKQVQNSSYLWQPKADSLRWLLPRAAHALEQSNPVFATAKERGLTDKTEEMIASRDRLRQLATEVKAALESRKI